MPTAYWRGNKKDEAGTRNHERAERAHAALTGYMEGKHGADEENAELVDLFADLLHLAASKGMIAEDCLNTALMHFEAERN